MERLQRHAMAPPISRSGRHPRHPDHRRRCGTASGKITCRRRKGIFSKAGGLQTTPGRHHPGTRRVTECDRPRYRPRSQQRFESAPFFLLVLIQACDFLPVRARGINRVERDRLRWFGLDVMQEMESPEFFSIAEGYGRFCPQGQMSLQEAAALVTRAIVFCRDNKIPKLLVDVTRLTGFPSPSVVDRYWFVREWPAEARAPVSAATGPRP